MFFATSPEPGPLPAAPVLHRRCRACSEPLPHKRLLAMPSATTCTACLVANGDVPRLRRFDEVGHTGDSVEVYFIRNPYIERQLQHRNRNGARSLNAFAMDHTDVIGVPVTNLTTTIMEEAAENRREAREN